MHITIKGKPLCLCRLSDKQFAKMAELVGGRWSCTYDLSDPKLDVVVNALKRVVKDPNTVEVCKGVHFDSKNLEDLELGSLELASALLELGAKELNAAKELSEQYIQLVGVPVKHDQKVEEVEEAGEASFSA